MVVKCNLFFKRYVTTIFYAVVLYTLAFCCVAVQEQDIFSNYFSNLFFVIILDSILMRTIDDIYDYNNDVTNNKVLFSKGVLTAIAVVTIVISIILSYSCLPIFNIILLGTVTVTELNFFQHKKDLSILKTVLLPLCVFYVFSNIGFTAVSIVFIGVAAIVGIVFYILKKG